MTLRESLAAQANRVDAALDRLVPPETEPPEIIHQAMRYSLFAGGKRIRPVLCLAAAECVAGDVPGIEPVACSLELIHTYSLIHDDLPALDNDDPRHGRPTCHKAYDEATAILAGDSLQVLAFHLLASHPGLPADAAIRVRIIDTLAVASSASCPAAMTSPSRTA